MRGLLRHQAPGRDPLPVRLRVPRDGARAPSRRASASSSTTSNWPCELIRDFNERQSQIFFLVTTFIVRYQPPELHSLADADVAEAAAALAATFETAARGVIYEHQAASGAGARLAAALKPVLAEAGQRGGTPFERDAAVVLRRLEEAARRGDGADPANPRALLELLGRVIRKTDDDSRAAGRRQRRRRRRPRA